MDSQDPHQKDRKGSCWYIMHATQRVWAKVFANTLNVGVRFHFQLKETSLTFRAVPPLKKCTAPNPFNPISEQ